MRKGGREGQVSGRQAEHSAGKQNHHITIEDSANAAGLWKAESEI